MPIRRAAGMRMLWWTMSARRTSAAKTSCPSGRLRSTAIERLPRCVPRKMRSVLRFGSPLIGSSLTTSAPRSARSSGPKGPAVKWPRSRTRTPLSGGPSSRPPPDAAGVRGASASTFRVCSPSVGARLRMRLGGVVVTATPGTRICLGAHRRARRCSRWRSRAHRRGSRRTAWPAAPARRSPTGRRATSSRPSCCRNASA